VVKENYIAFEILDDGVIAQIANRVTLLSQSNLFRKIPPDLSNGQAQNSKNK
jgi:hypothetical protein